MNANADYDFLMARIARAEAAFDADREQARLARDARADERAARMWESEVKARSFARRWRA